MLSPPNLTLGWSISYLRFSLLYLIFPLAFHTFFTGARPALSYPNACEPYVVKRGVSVHGTNNHLVSSWSLHQVPDATEDALILESDNHLSQQLHEVRHDGLGDKFEGQALEFDIKGHLVSAKSVIRRDEAGQLLELEIFNHLIPACGGIHRRYEAGETPVFSMDNNLVGVRGHTSDGTKGNLVLNIENNLVPLRHVICGAKAEDDVILPATRSIRQATKKYPFEKDTIAYIQEIVLRKLAKKAEEVKSSGLQPLSMIGPSVFKLGENRSYTTHDPGDGFVAGHPTMTAGPTVFMPRLGEDIITQSQTNILSFIWGSETTAAFINLAEQTLSHQEPMVSGFNSTAVYNESLVSPPGIPASFCRVVGIAIGLGILLAIPSLLMICAVSRKGQHIWIRTVNINQPSIQQMRREGAYYDGESSIATEEQWSGISSRQDGESPGISNRITRQVIVNMSSSGVSSRQDTERINKLRTAHRQNIDSANRSATASRQDMNRPGFFQRWLGSTFDQVNITGNSGIFQRWFGWGSAKHVNFEDSPSHIAARGGRKIKSTRTRGGSGAPDPTVILTEVAERLIRERMRQLSTIPSVGEEEEARSAIFGTGEEESSSMSSIRAVATGSTMGTQRRDNTVRRNCQGILRTFGEFDGVDALTPMTTGGHGIADDSNSTLEGSQEDGPAGGEGNESKGKVFRSVRFDESADKIETKHKGTFGRASIRHYLFPTVEDDVSSIGEVSSSENAIIDVSGTIVKKERKGERTGDPWKNMFNVSGDMVVSTGSTVSGGTGIELKRQVGRGFEVNSSGSSIGDDSTLTVSTDDNAELVVADGQLPMEEEHRLTSGESVLSSGFLVGNVLGSNQVVRTEPDMSMVMDGVVNDEYGVSAFGIRAKSPRWDSQTSDNSQLSSGYFTGSSSVREIMDSGPDFDSFPLMDRKQDAGTKSRTTMHGALNI